MRYISSAEAAEKWGITANRVTILAKNGQIPGAIRVGYRWRIPENAEKPADRRTEAAKSAKERPIPFRFPLYVNFSETDYDPPLSEAEKQL